MLNIPTPIKERGLRRNIGYRAFVQENKGVISEGAYGFFLSDTDNGGLRYYIRNEDRLRIPKPNYGRPGFRVYSFRVRLGLPSRTASDARSA